MNPEPYQQYYQTSGNETGRDEATRTFVNFGATSPLFFGTTVGGADMEYNGRDLSYEALAADAERDMRQGSQGDGSFELDETLSPHPSSFDFIHDPNFDSALNFPPRSSHTSRQHNPSRTWVSTQNAHPDGTNFPPLPAWGHSPSGFDTSSDNLQSSTAIPTTVAFASPSFGHMNQYFLSPSSGNDYSYHPSSGTTPTVPFSQDVAQSSLRGHHPSNSQSVASTDNTLSPNFHPHSSVPFSRQPSRENRPTLVLCPPQSSNDSNMTGVASRGAAGMFSTTPYPGQAARFQSYNDHGQLVHRCPVRDCVNTGGLSSWNMFFVAADLQSSNASTIAHSGYAPSETESSHTTYTSHADSYQQHLTVPIQNRSRRQSEPSPVPESHHSNRLDRSLSSRSSRGNRQLASRTHPALQPRPRHDSTETRSSSSSSNVPPRRKKGMRRSPLSPDTREEANKTRIDRTVCIGCKISKVGCKIPDGSNNCLRCTQSSSNSSDKKPFECTPAYFIERVEEASTNSIAQHVINHVYTDGYHRRCIDLPSNIDIADLLGRLDTLRRHYVIRVSRDGTHLYDLDLDACHKYIQHTCPPESHPFEKFINSRKIHKNDRWKSCVRDGPSYFLRNERLYEALLAWGEMPSWVTYSLFLISHPFSGRALDPENEEDIPTLILAAQLSRIVVRKLELEAYDKLQKKLLENSKVTIDILWDLGRIVLSLRRRVAWWRCLGTGAHQVGDGTISDQENEDDDSSKDPINRITSLCYILYIYWCFMRRRLLSYEDSTGLDILTVRYPDSIHPVDERFPAGLENIKVFREWMNEGLRNFRDACVEDRRVPL